MSTSKFRISSVLFLISTIGAMAVHWYLVSQHIAVKYAAESGSAMCNISETINCATTIMSSFSEVFGIPLAVFGFITNLFILVFGLRSLYLDQDPKKSTAITLGLALFSVAASVVMGLISVAVLKSLCPFCTIAYILSFVTFFAVLKWTTGFNSGVLLKYGKNIAMHLVIIFAVSFLAGKVVLSSVISAETREMMALVLADWKSKSAMDIELVDPLKLGPDSAKMKIVEFSDFLCPHCKNALPKLHNFANMHKNDVQIIFQNFPLDGCGGSETNPGRRCDLAKLAYCAQKQGKGWEAQEHLFAIQETNYNISDLEKNDIPQMAQSIGADAEVLKTCVKDSETLKTVKAQLELGKKIGVEGTPAMFINNKPFKGGPSPVIFQEIFQSL